MTTTAVHAAIDPVALAADVKRWARAAGFQRVGIAGIERPEDEARLVEWLDQGLHGTMDYMARHGYKRSRPDVLVPGTLRVVSVGLDYLPEAADMEAALADRERAYVSRYALGRDYHKLMRQRLQRLADRIASEIGPFGYRAFADSAPVLEKPIARDAGIGFVGKHTNLIDREGGSWFFLGELYTDLPLPVDVPEPSRCGTCTRCIEVCPTRAIVGPYRLDARRCISYLTIELRDAIPVELRPLIGNRIYGCDDCQLVCPWNKFAKTSVEPDFAVRHGLDRASLVELFAWDEAEFLAKTEGSAIRRIGHEAWLRNIATALGNAPTSRDVVAALRSRAEHPSPLVREHVAWALSRHGNPAA